MASINQIADTIVAMFQKSPLVVPMIHGAPGMGKSAITWQIAERLDIPRDRTMAVHIASHDVVDFTGCPSIEEGMTIFNPTEMFYRFAEGTGPGMIILEELAQSSVHHQTWAAGFILDRETPTFRLDPEVRIIATGNRAEDRAGAKPMLSHLNDRMYHFDADTDVDGWVAWAMENGIGTKELAFIRFRRELLNKFDPDQRCNPTQRSWTKLFTEVPHNLKPDLYLLAARGMVGDAAAAEWVAARNMMQNMPSVDDVRSDPEGTEVPDEPSVQYAIVTALALSAGSETVDTDMRYVSRFKKDFMTVYMTDAYSNNKDIGETNAFAQMAADNADVFLEQD